MFQIFRCTLNGSNKIWACRRTGTGQYEVMYGASRARLTCKSIIGDMQKKVTEKLGDGYVAVSGTIDPTTRRWVQSVPSDPVAASPVPKPIQRKYESLKIESFVNDVDSSESMLL